MAASTRRIVSLLPSATEIVFALGLEAELVGRSHECEFPPSVTSLPVLTAPKFNPEGSSLDIDRRVRSIVSEALSVYRVDAAKLRELRPDFIVTQSQCEVCAVSETEVEEAVADWLDARPVVISLGASRLEDIWTDVERVGMALGVPDRGIEVARRLRQRVQAIREKAAKADNRPDVACIEWIEPLMAAGNWMPEMVEIAGGKNLFGARGKHSPMLSFEELCAADPEIILVAPCGFTIARSLGELSALAGRKRWLEIEAVKQGQVFVADGNQYFNRPGPRIADSIEILAEIIHPASFHFGHEGSGWQRL